MSTDKSGQHVDVSTTRRKEGNQRHSRLWRQQSVTYQFQVGVRSSQTNISVEHQGLGSLDHQMGKVTAPEPEGSFMPNDVVIAQTTSDNEDLAKTLARGAVESKLAAGVHIDAPITAYYWWEGQIEAAQEWRISYMTTVDRLATLEAWVHERHPYDVPQWITLPVTGGSEAYLSWVAEERASG